jgi:tetratricopeptide (TPR) repeat protein
MNFSNNYIFYPNNSELVKAIDHYKSLRDDQNDVDDAPDTSVTAKDIFIHTRGNFELRRFNTSILEPARESLESLLTEKLREQAPLQWAAIQNSLGNILAALGQQRMDVGLYENAIASFNLALEEFSQENTPSEWAVSQYNLGTATQALGGQQDDSKLLKASVDAYTNALLVWTRKQMPLEWATTMYQLGASFHVHGKQLKGKRTLEKAVVSFKNALVGFDADDHALELAATHNSRGAALHNLAESEENVERLEDAIRSYETALTVCMEQQLPFHLAVLCRVNKSTAKGVMAELTKDLVLADEVADDFELIIECFHDILQPLCLKHCEQQLEHAKTLMKKFSVTA